MKNFWLLFSLCVFCFFNPAEGEPSSFSETSAAELKTEASPIDTDVNRIGINLGQWTQYGTAQFGANLLMNPGFEGHVDRHIVITTLSDSGSFSDEENRKFDDNF